jgi:hypothetical protein
MPTFRRVVWKSKSTRRIISRRKKPFKSRPVYQHLQRLDVSHSDRAAKSPSPSDVDMLNTGSPLHSSADSYEDQNVQDEMESSPGSDTHYTTSDNEFSNISVPESDYGNMLDENDEWSYDANEALQVRNIENEVELLSRKFEEQVISTREEQIAREAFKLNEKLIAGWAEDTVQLSLRLETRGLYPLMPMTWKSDFPFVGQHLFAKDPEEAYFSPYASASRYQRVANYIERPLTRFYRRPGYFQNTCCPRGAKHENSWRH